MEHGTRINTNLYSAILRVDGMVEDPALYEEKSFVQRADVIDFIEFEVIAEIEYQLLKVGDPAELNVLKNRAESVKAKLEAVDTNLFKKMHSAVQSGRYYGQAFKNLVNQYVDFNIADKEHQQEPGYDNLDLFVNGALNSEAVPGQTITLEPEMVYYQKTPARTVFELTDLVDFTNEDIFFDLGSGLGQVAILVNILTGIRTRGIEFEPAFYNYAVNCAKALNLSNVTFINTDARQADFSEGTIFFMFTPFKGEILREVLTTLKQESAKRKIKVITYGPCTAGVARQSWLIETNPKVKQDYSLTVFSSR